MPNQLTVQGYPARLNGIPKTIQAQGDLIKWSNSNQDAPDYWLRRIITEAFCRMIARRMQDAPAADVIQVVAEDWVDIVGEGMNCAQDIERVVAGFRKIFRECRRWPQPVDLMKRLPNRPPQAKLNAPAPTEEQHQRAADEFQKIIDMFKGY